MPKNTDDNVSYFSVDQPSLHDFREFVNQARVTAQDKSVVNSDSVLHDSIYLSHSPGYMGIKLKPPIGVGDMELLELPNGLTIGRSRYQLSYELESEFSHLSKSLGFALMLEGSFGLSIPELKLKDQIRSGDVWVRSGEAETVMAVQRSGMMMGGISVDLNEKMLSMWKEEAPAQIKSALRKGVTGSQPLCFRYLTITPAIHRQAMKMMHCQTLCFCEQLEYESMGLSLLAQLFSPQEKDVCLTPAERRHSRHKRLINEALEILHAEWQEPPTISELAQRIGMNECYLKSGFRERVGMTIGQYVRRLRMG